MDEQEVIDAISRYDYDYLDLNSFLGIENTKGSRPRVIHALKKRMEFLKEQMSDDELRRFSLVDVPKEYK
jgi:hypothetical protein